MKHFPKYSNSLLLAISLVGLTACSKDEAPAPKVETKPASGLQKTMDNAVGQAQKAAAEVKSGTEKATHELSIAATKAAADATKAAGEAAHAVGDKAKAAADAAKQAVPNISATVTAETQKLIDQAKAFLTENKYPEALEALKSLGTFQLTPEQAGLVDSLKARLKNLPANPAVTAPPKVPGNLPSVPKQ